MENEPFENIELALQELHQLRTIIKSLPDPVAIFDTHGRIILANPAMRTLLGPHELDPDTMTTVRRLKARHPGNRPLEPDDLPWVRPLRGETVTDVQVCYDDAEGREHFLQYSAGPLREHDQIVGAVAIGRDITEHERTRREGINHMTMLEAIFSTMVDSLIFFDQEGRVIRMNDVAGKVLNFTDEQKNMTLHERGELMDFETPDGRPLPLDQAPLARALRGETVRNVPLIMKRHNGPTHHFLVSTAPMKNPDGSLRGVVATFSDISLLHEVEIERETFVHTISHDLRSPLAAIRGFAHMLKEDLQEQRVNGESLQFLNLLESNAVKMSNMISDLVDSARLEGGRLPIREERLDLRLFLDDLLRRSETAISTERIRLNVPPDLPPVAADPDRLDRILINLLSNALKFSPPDADVIVSVRPQTHDVLIAIRDFGAGIPPQHIPHLFARYHIAKMKESIESVGLGLYITRLLVEAHHGHIWVDSTLNMGSTFYFTLPIFEEGNGYRDNEQ